MNPRTKALAIAVTTMLTMSAFAQNANNGNDPVTPLVVINNEPAPELIIASPVPEALARGVAVVPYRVEHFRILPILGAGAANVSPRAGHLHVTVSLGIGLISAKVRMQSSSLGCLQASTS